MQERENLDPEVLRRKVIAFRSANHLRQRDLGEFLGVSAGFISSVEKGTKVFPAEQFSKLLGNDRGWNIECLESGAVPSGSIHYDYRSQKDCSNTENGDVKNYYGYSEEQVAQKVRHELDLANAEIRRLETEKAMLLDQINFLKARQAAFEEKERAFLETIGALSRGGSPETR